LEKRGGSTVALELYTMGETNFLPQLTRIKAGSPDALFIVAGSQDASMIVKQAKEVGLNKPIVGLGALASDTFIKLAKEAAEGVYSLSQYLDVIDSPENKAFVDAYRQRYPKMPLPDKYAWGSYTSIKVIIKAIEQAGSTDPEKIRQALEKVAYDGITGKIEFDQKHQAYPDVFVTVVENGRPKVIQRISTR